MAANKSLLERMQTSVNKRLPNNPALLMRGGLMSRSQVRETIPTGVKAIDRYVLGIGGLPVGRIVEVSGLESVGKSSLLYQILGNAQKEKTGWAALADTECAFSEERTNLFGVDPKNLLLLESETIEKLFIAFQTSMKVVDPKTEGPGCIGWDSLAATMTDRQLLASEDPKLKEKVAERAAFLAQKLAPLESMLTEKRVCLVTVNQIRLKIGKIFGDATTTPGGNSWHHFCSVRLRLSAGKAFKIGDEKVGRWVYIEAKKNRFAPPFRKIQAKFWFAQGWDERATTVLFAKEQKLVSTMETDDKNYIKALEGLGWYKPKEPLVPEISDEGSSEEVEGDEEAFAGVDDLETVE